MLLQAVRLSVCHTGGSVTRSQAVARIADRTATAPLGSGDVIGHVTILLRAHIVMESVFCRFYGNKIGMKTRDISSVFSQYNSILFPNITSQ